MIFTIFAPVYLFIMFTSLTEIFFSFVLVAAIYLFIRKRFIWSAIVISLIPFVRTEGFMYIVLFIVPLVWTKQYKSLPFLLTGFIIFSIAGWPLYQDPFWFFTKMPYSSAGSELYGRGSFWYYFKNMNSILDYPLIILCIVGIISLILNLRKGLKNLSDIKYITLYFLVIPSFFGFILAQSFLWWQGMMGVLASTRFIACVLPLSAILAVAGFEKIMDKAKFNRIVYIIMGAFIISLIIYKPINVGKVPMKTGLNFAVMEELTNWLKSTHYANRRALYSDPMFPFYMDIDPYDTKRCFRVYSYKNTDPATLLEKGELLIWDAQFSGFEGKLTYDSLLKNNNMRLINVFTPRESFTIIGGEKYKLAVFEKAPRDTTQKVFKQFYLNDFENNLSEDHIKHISTTKSYSGRNSIVLNRDFIYSPTIEDKLTNLPAYSTISLRASVQVMNPSPDEKGKIILVLEVDDADHKVYKYLTANDMEITYMPGKWFEMSYTDVISRTVPAGGAYKAYVWYTGTNKIYIDDLKLEYMPIGYE
jgi:hypothetical protein